MFELDSQKSSGSVLVIRVRSLIVVFRLRPWATASLLPPCPRSHSSPPLVSPGGDISRLSGHGKSVTFTWAHAWEIKMIRASSQNEATLPTHPARSETKKVTDKEPTSNRRDPVRNTHVDDVEDQTTSLRGAPRPVPRPAAPFGAGSRR